MIRAGGADDDVAPYARLRSRKLRFLVIVNSLTLNAHEQRYLQEELGRMRGDAAGHRRESIAALKLLST